VSDGINGTLVSDGDFEGALARVPDYDPAVVASTASRFSADVHRERMAEIWRLAQGRETSAEARIQ
jgi:hypothetical protein